MKRTALYIGFPYTAGLLAASVVHRQLWFWLVAVVALLAAVVILYRRDVWKYVLVSTLSMVTACCVYWGHDAFSVQKQLAFAGRENVEFSGEITDLTYHESGYVTCILNGTFDGAVPANISFLTDDCSCEIGDTLTLIGTPERLSSSYVFDSEAYYRSRNVHLSMPFDAEMICIPRTHETLRSILFTWRMKMTERIHARMEGESGAFLTGMLFGDKSAMSDSMQNALYRTGIGHVLAVSGLHMDFLALLVVHLLRKLGTGRKESFFVLALLSILFVICVGETISVKRACIMILLSQSAGIFFRRADMLNTTSIAMLVLALENPFVIHSAAFWLSFSGTFGIAIFAPYMTKDMKTETLAQKVLSSLAAMFCVFLAVLPASVLYFREISLVSPIANLTVVPICMLILLLGVLVLFFGAHGPIAQPLFSALQFLSETVLRIADFTARLPWAYTAADSRILLVCVLLSLLLVILCYICFRKRSALSLAIALSLAVTCIAAGTERSYMNRNFHIAVLGQERDCVLVLRKGSDAVIVDLSGDTAAPRHVQAYLQSSGVKTVNSLFLCKPNEKSVSRYAQVLRHCSPLHTVVTGDTDETTDLSIFGTSAVYTPTREILFHGAVIRISKNHVTVDMGSVKYVCTQEKSAAQYDCELLTVYGTSKNVLPDAGILIVLDERSCYMGDDHTFVGENNLELAIAENGKCRIRSLYANR